MIHYLLGSDVNEFKKKASLIVVDQEINWNEHIRAHSIDPFLVNTFHL